MDSLLREVLGISPVICDIWLFCLHREEGLFSDQGVFRFCDRSTGIFFCIGIPNQKVKIRVFLTGLANLHTAWTQHALPPFFILGVDLLPDRFQWQKGSASSIHRFPQPWQRQGYREQTWLVHGCALRHASAGCG